MATENDNGRCLQTIGEIIKSLRVTSGMTPEQLGDSAQLSPSYIRKLEGGLRHDITLDTAKKLADGLGVSPEVFFDAEIAKPSTLLVPAANPQAARQLLQWAGSIQAGIGSLLEEDERLCVLSDAASEAIVVLDEGTVLFVNRALINMLGVGGDPDQLMGFDALDPNSLMNYIAPGSVAEAHRLATTLVESGKLPPTPLTLDILRSDGSHLTVWVRGKIMEYRGRTVYVVILRDSSWEKACEADRQESIDWDAALKDMVARGIINGEHLESQAVVIHNAARILYANQRTAALLGIADARKLVGQTPLSFVSPGSLTTVLYHMAGSDEGSETIDIVSNDGSILPACVRWQTINYRGAVVRVSYITELVLET